MLKFTSSVLLLVLMLSGHPSLGCECAISHDVASSFDDSTVVVVAKAISLRKGKAFRSIAGDKISLEQQDVDWEVQRWWKGPYLVGQRFHTKTVAECCMCGREVAKDQRMLLYLSNEFGVLSVSACGRTAPVDQSASDIATLDDIQKRVGDSSSLTDWKKQCTTAGIQEINPASEMGKMFSPFAKRCTSTDACVLSCERNDCGGGAGGCFHSCGGRSSYGSNEELAILFAHHDARICAQPSK